jgi:N-acetylglucosaminyldiphosphoundecaprenol N-acetyl-beta-D-mannosaminyltransferase
VASLAFENEKLREILGTSLLTLPDGKPLEWVARIKGFKKVKTVSGYWLLVELLRSKKSHFFYGTNEKTLNKIRQRIDIEFPEANVLGYKSPPILNNLNSIEKNKEISDDIKYINSLKPDLIWIGISSPKQDYLMGTYYSKLDQGLMMGIGGVFDYFAGIHKKGPEWLKKAGFRWLYRLAQNPRRLWKKYFFACRGLLRLILIGFVGYFRKRNFTNNTLSQP